LRDTYFQDFERELRRPQFTAGLEAISTAAAEQLRQIRTRSVDFEKLLGQKLNPSEITYERYIEVSNRTFELALSNLERIKGFLVGAMNLNPDLILEKIKKNVLSPKKIKRCGRKKKPNLMGKLARFGASWIQMKRF